MSEPVKRLAVYYTPTRLSSGIWRYPWAVCPAPIPERYAFNNLEIFRTHAEAFAYAEKETAHAAKETP